MDSLYFYLKLVSIQHNSQGKYLLPGVGIIYAGRVGLGLVILLLSVLLAAVFVGIIFWIYGMYKAYKMCVENNRIWADYLASRA